MINYTAIQKILDKQLQTIVYLPAFTPENIKAAPQSTNMWSRSTLLPAETQIIGVGSDGQRMDQGLYQIDLYTAQNSGSIDINVISDAIQNGFVRGQYYTDTDSGVSVLINSVFRLVGGGLPSTAFYHIPIFVRWAFYTDH